MLWAAEGEEEGGEGDSNRFGRFHETHDPSAKTARHTPSKCVRIAMPLIPPLKTP